MEKYKSGKLRRWEKLSREGQADLLYDLLKAFTLIKSFPEAAEFITDLLTREEVRFISKRLGIAKLLLSDFSYQEIAGLLRVSHATIAKVAGWLNEKGDGFRKVIGKIPPRKRLKNPDERSNWEKFKRSHVASFYPELILEDLENGRIKNENRRIKKALADLTDKKNLLKEIDDDYRKLKRG